MKSPAEKVWIYRFALESESGEPVDGSSAEALMEKIVNWAEENGLQIGGGYRAPLAEDELPISQVPDEKM